MPEYIEREALIKELNSKSVVHQMDNENFHYKQGYLTGLLKAVVVAKTLPIADVVEVVRCKDCKFCEEWHNKNIWCNKHKVFMSMKPNDFCSYGELKECERK